MIDQTGISPFQRANSINKNIVDLDYKKPKVDIYMPSDIFTKCANPDDEIMEDIEQALPDQEDEKNDYDKCVVEKPQRGNPFGEDDLEFMSLMPDPSGEAQLFAIVNKQMKETVRKQKLMSSQAPDIAAIKQID